MTEKKLIEKLAETMHSTWAWWMLQMFERGGTMQRTLLGRDVWVMNPGRFQCWQRQANAAYADLSENERESDRKVVKEHMGWLIQRLRRELAKVMEDEGEGVGDKKTECRMPAKLRDIVALEARMDAVEKAVKELYVNAGMT